MRRWNHPRFHISMKADFIMILIQEEDALKSTASVVIGGPLYRENIIRRDSRDCVRVEGICGCESWKPEGYM